MSEETQAASSPAEVADVFNGETPSLAEFNHYRETGEVPERFRPAENAESASAEEEDDPSEGEESESASESDTGEEQQEKGKKPKRQTAEERIAQLEATIDKIKRGAGIERKAEVATATDSKDQPKVPQNYGEWRKSFKPSEWIEQYGKDHPQESYEDANAAMSDYLDDIRSQFKAIEQQRSSQAKELTNKVTDARSRYGEEFDEILQPTVEKIVSDARINPAIKEVINDSDLIADLIFVLGTDEKALNDLRSLPTGKALRYIAALENGIIEELAETEEETPRDEDGKFVASPAKPKTNAPKPPSPVGGASTGAFDVSDESLSPEEWMRKRNADLAKRKG